MQIREVEDESAAEISSPVAELLRVEFPNDEAGRRTQGAFIYQHLYVLRLMRRIFDRELDAYICESGSDFLAAKSGDGGNFAKLELIEIKSRSKRVFGKNASQAMAELRKLAELATGLRVQYPTTHLVCRLVFSRGEEDVEFDVQRLEKLARQVAWPVECRFEAEAFISAEPTLVEMQDELVRLFAHEPELTALFANAQNSEAFLETVIGLTLPFHSPRIVRSLGAWIETGLRVGAVGLNTDQAIETVQSAVTRMITSARERRTVKHDRIADVIGPIGGVVWGLPIRSQRDPRWWELGNETTARRLLRIAAHMPSSDPSLAPQLAIRRDAKQFAVEFDLSGLVPLRQYLARPTTTHRKRTLLVLSFAEAIGRWASAGLVITGAFADYSNRWFVRENGGKPQFVQAGFNGLAAFDPLRGAARWVWTSPLASALCQLYYGCESVGALRKVLLQKHGWDDFVIGEFAEHLESYDAIQAADLSIELKELFTSWNRWPIFISRIDMQFLRDTLNASKYSPLEALCEAQPNSWQMAPGRVYSEIIYARCGLGRGPQEVQVGLLYNGNGTFTAYRYFRYDVERWTSHRARDRQLALPIRPAEEQSAFVLLRQAADWREMASEMFDISSQDVLRWVDGALANLRRAALRPENTPLHVTQEYDLHVIRRSKLENLRSDRLPCVVTDDDGKVTVTTDREMLKRRVEDSGYRLDAIDGIRLHVEDDAGNRVRGDIRPGFAQSKGKLHLTLNPLPDSARTLANGGHFELLDRGLDAIVGAEQALFNSLIASFQISGPDIPKFSRDAWDFIAAMVGKHMPGANLPIPLWNGEFQVVGSYTAETDSDMAGDILRSFESPESWQILTGAPGTGKTRVVAELAARYLDKYRDRVFPPCRVLIVANTHWAVDNYVRAFRRDKTRKHLILRAISPLPRARLGEESEARREFLEDLDQTFQEEVRPNLPLVTEEPARRRQLDEYRARLAHVRDRLRTAEASAKERGHGCLIPSHVAWRRNNALLPALFAHDLGRSASIVEETLRGLDAYQSSEEVAMPGSGQLADLTVFAAQLVAATVDGLRRLPDMGFDLVIFEEASQLSITSMLKVLTQVIRSRSPETNLHVVLSGDPQQLPPYREHRLPKCITQKHLKLAHGRSLAGASFFANICYEAAERVRTLTVQHRMHPEIATLVSNIFYTNERWECRQTSTENEPAVYWIDPSRFDGRCQQEPTGPSWLNLGESEVVRRLYAAPKNRNGHFLAVTPYSAQRRLLESILSEKDASATVDGCQGIEAETVVFSFVRMANFVLDYRRLNVAFSRAKDRLYLVGNFSELTNSSTDEYGKPRPHILGLIRMFSPGGIFANRLLIPEPDWIP